jgi:hypothetical protein
MTDREGFETQREAQRETLGKSDKATRERIWEGLSKYLAAEASHARKAAAAEKRRAQAEEEEHRDRRGS